MKFRLFILVLLFFQCSGLHHQNIQAKDRLPEWVHNPHSSYPQSMYLVGIGTGDTRSDAENNAIGSISKIFQAKVDVDETLLEQYLESNEGTQFTSQMLNKTRVGSQQQLKNIKIAQSFFYEDEGLYYVLAYLDRMETEELYRADIERNHAKIADYYNNYQQSQDKLGQYAFLQKAIDLLHINEILYAQYEIINVTGEAIEPPVSLSELEKQRMALLNQISVALTVTGENQQEIATYLQETLGKTGFKIVESDADFSFNSHFELTPADLNRENITGYNWRLSIEVRDHVNQFTLKTFTLKNRTMGISDDQAMAKIMTIVQKELNNNFYNQFMDYIRKL